MHHHVNRTSSRLVLPLALSLLTFRDAAAEEARQATAAGGPPCPTVAEIEQAIGFPVRSRPVPIDGCMYELTGQYEGVFVTMSYQPATRAEDIYAEIRQRVKVKGMKAQPDRLTLGEGGWGYSSRGKNEAAVVSQGRLYYVELDYNLFDGLKLPADAAVRVIELGMRTAPGARPAAGGGGERAAAPLDACMLATNAEVGRVAEEKPEILKYWSAPTASYGGSHCDYDGGSIRVYQGKAPAADFEGMLKALQADKLPRTPVSGIGDKAFFMIPKPNDPYNRLGLLAVYAGPRVVQFILDAQGDEPIEATRPRLERFAKLVLPRLQ